MQDEFIPILLDLTRRHDNVIWIRRTKGGSLSRRERENDESEKER